MAKAEQPVDSGAEYGIYSNYGNATNYNNYKTHDEQASFPPGAGVAENAEDRNLRGGP